MIYRIEKYNKKKKCWVPLYSSSSFDEINKYLKDYLDNHRYVWIRLNTLLKKHYEE